ncbi:MAG TPA: hypothetical protein VIF09_07795 [Polyangiaceae bacterium]
MTLLDPVRLLEHVHGHIGWLAAIALIHPAIVLRRPTRKAPWAVGLATGVVTLAGCLGAYIYGDYRDKLRQSIFQHARVIGYLFERKEHLAFGAFGLAWAGCLAYLAAAKLEGDAREKLRKASHWAFVLAAILTVVTAALGTVIATYKTF